MAFVTLGKWLLRKMGLMLVAFEASPLHLDFPIDFSSEEIEDILAVRQYTMTSKERLVTLIHAVQHIATHKIPGSIVECGVWRGGSMMAAARTLMRLGDTSRDLYLFDTFEGMSEPRAEDQTHSGEKAQSMYNRLDKWCFASLEEVQEAVLSVGYAPDRIHFIKGKVEQTLIDHAPATIALLRLDTDWYESTRCELETLFPRLSKGGILIVDDYGYWKGARKAVDEYLQRSGVQLFLSRIDATGRVAVKMN